MALINRITRLFRADMHAVLDRLEEPQSLLRQSVREMEEAIAEEMQRLRLMQHECEQMSARQQQLQAAGQQLEEELGLCFDSGEEALARKLLRRKLEGQRAADYLGRRHASLGQALAEGQQALAEQRGRLQSMQQKLELLGEQEASADEPWPLASEISVSEEEVEVAFLREQQRRAAS